MPPFREKGVKVDRKLDGDALKMLRDVGHGHRINIVDASYNIPEGAQVIKFPGTSAEAYSAVLHLIPVDEDMDAVTIMGVDRSLDDDEAALRAMGAFSDVERQLNEEGLGSNDNPGTERDWSESFAINRLSQESLLGGEGFYDIANNPNVASTFIRTIDELPFACASIVVGHSQRAQ